MKLIFNSPLETIHHPLLQTKGIELVVKRDDLIHPHISGNKWRKLKYTLLDAKEKRKNHLVTFGGAYSNHLLATACAGHLFGFQTSAFVRGEKHEPLNPVLKLCSSFGMHLRYIARESYRAKASLFKQYYEADQNAYFIDEGGSSALAVKGVAELVDELEEPYDFIFAACGTGATLAGIAHGLAQHQLPTKAIGIAVLKGAEFLKNDIHQFIPSLSNWELLLDFHQGGYAKTSPELVNWMHTFNAFSHLPIEPVYTGKLFYALFQLIEQNHFQPGTRILAIHTGGIIP